MGYLVGRHCYETQAEATNHVMTHVLPVIDKDGVLHHPVFNGTTWIFNQQTIQLTLFLLSNLIEIAELNEQEVENVSKVLEKVFLGKSKEVLSEFRGKIMDDIYKDIGINRIK